MKGILWISGLYVDEEEMAELRKTVRKINKKRKKEGREKLDYVCTTGRKTHVNVELANR